MAQQRIRSSAPARGRHRKPNHHARNLGIATAPLVAALPMIAATATPSAAATSAWDRLAGCESGGNWGINTGNGYYGGLQFNLGTWQAYGGQGMPNEQPAWYQAQIADRVRVDSGLGHWPHCGAYYS